MITYVSIYIFPNDLDHKEGIGDDPYYQVSVNESLTLLESQSRFGGKLLNI